VKTVVIGEKLENKKYDFRETCFGICNYNGKLLLVEKKGQLSFVGGGIESKESHEDCLKREFLEESGYELVKMTPLVTIDCFWLAAGKWPLESLANFYIVEVGRKLGSPTEEGHVVKFIDLKDADSVLPLPYHKKALEIFINLLNLLKSIR